MTETDDEAFAAILDLCTGWHRPMSGVERVLAIKEIAEAALTNRGKDTNAMANEAFDYMRKSKDENLTKDERKAWETKAKEVWEQ